MVSEFKDKYQLVIIGAGPAGLGAALAAEERGVKDILLLERDYFLGGILPQCIHNGFGLDYFGEELTGPEYAHRFIDRIPESTVQVMDETMVLDITPDKEITALNRHQGVQKIEAKAVLLAMGCRERTREAIKIPGDRTAGVLTAGTAQRYINIEGYLPGRKVIVLGSGDIGLIMARRMTLEGAEVDSVLEIMPYSSGLVRNKVQCLDDFDIPLKLNHTLTRIEGDKRVERVVVSRVNDDLEPVPGSEQTVECDTVLLAVGLIPENELTKQMGIELDPVTGGAVVNEQRETEINGVFACGNVLQVHDLVDYVTEESEIAARAVSEYLSRRRKKRRKKIKLTAGEQITYVVPHRIDYVYQDKDKKTLKLFLRSSVPVEEAELKVVDDRGQELISSRKKIVTPGEMETIILPLQFLDEDTEELTVSVTKASQGAD